MHAFQFGFAGGDRVAFCGRRAAPVNGSDQAADALLILLQRGAAVGSDRNEQLP